MLITPHLVDPVIHDGGNILTYDKKFKRKVEYHMADITHQWPLQHPPTNPL